MLRLKRSPFVVIPILATLPGCLAAAVAVGVAAGIVITETAISEDTVESEMRVSPNDAFEAAKEELKILSTEPVSVREEILQLEGKYSDSTVTATILSAAESNRCRLRVKSRKLGFPTLETARYVLHRIQDRLAKR